MLEKDKKEFASIVSATLKTYRVEPDADVLRLWWGSLSRFTIEQVRDGFNRFIGSKESKYSVVPANIIEAIEANEPDGRLGAEEAWAMYPHDESTSAVITTEMAEAMQAAKLLMDEGDLIGARMAFKEAYSRIVAQNKLNGISPKWFPSLGHSPEGREQALKVAVEKGRLTQDHAISLLPAPQDSQFARVLPELLLLAGKADLTDEQLEKNRSRMAEIRKILSK